MPKPSDCLAVLLNPSTKMFAGWLLDDGELLNLTTNLLKEKNQDSYKALKTRDMAEEVNVLEEPRPPDQEIGLEDHEDNSGDEDNDLDGPSIVPVPLTTDVGDLIAEADDVFEQWMAASINFGDYLFDKAQPLVANRRTGKVTFRELVSKFDTMKYYRLSGSKEYPSITLLARIHFSTMLTSAFQEKVFSTCKHVMGNDQARMALEHLEKKALLVQNAKLIREGII